MSALAETIQLGPTGGYGNGAGRQAEIWAKFSRMGGKQTFGVQALRQGGVLVI